MTKTNIDVKLEAIRKGVNLCELPARLKISPSKFYVLMRSPLNYENRERILKAIKEIADSR